VLDLPMPRMSGLALAGRMVDQSRAMKLPS
jgi:hypothetical protein